jgi:hypothetical protein
MRTLQSYREYTPEDYLQGRVKLPPWIHTKRQIPYIYTGQATASTSFTVQITCEKDSYFLVEAISIISTGTTDNPGKDLRNYATIQIEDKSRDQKWSSDFVNIYDLAGIGPNPKYLKNPVLLLPSTVLLATVRDKTGVFYLSLAGRKIYDLSREEAAFLCRRLNYQYVLSLPTLSSGAVAQTASVQIMNESDFLLQAISGATIFNYYPGTIGTVSNEVLMQLRDTSQDKSLFAQKTPIRLFTGAYYGPLGSNYMPFQPFCFPQPILIRRNAILQAEFDNPTGADFSAAASLVFEGARIYDA